MDHRVLRPDARPAAQDRSVQRRRRLRRSGAPRAFASERLEDRTLLNGSLDLAFGGDGLGSYFVSEDPASASDVAVLDDGRIVVVGTVNSGGNQDFAAIRLNPDGTLDPTFGTLGQVVVPFDFGGGNVDRATSVAIDAEGRILIGGQTEQLDVNFDFAVTRLLDDGELDTSFGIDGRVVVPFDLGGVGDDDDLIQDLAVQEDGKIVAVGAVEKAEDNFDFGAVRLNADGTRDLSFGGDGRAVVAFDRGGTGDDFANGVAIDTAGRIVMAGSVERTLGNDFGAARLNPDGSLDTGFGPDGDGKAVVAFDLLGGGNDAANDLALQADGKIVLAGIAQSLEGDRDFAAARLNADGGLDTSFGDDGLRAVAIDLDPQSHTNDDANAVILQPDGKIVLAGSAERDLASLDFAAVRLNADGSLDTGFGGGGRSTFGFNLGGLDSEIANAAALQADGKLLLVGRVDRGFNVPAMGVARLDADGSLDTRFDDLPGRMTVPLAGSAKTMLGRRDVNLAVLPDGRSVLVGTVNGDVNTDFAVALVSPTGQLDPSFGDGGVVELAFDQGGLNLDRGMAVVVDAASETILVGGSVETADRGFDFGLARLDFTGSLDTSFGDGGRLVLPFDLGGNENDFLKALALDDAGRILPAGEISRDLGQDFGVARLNPDGSLDTSFGDDGFQTVAFDVGGQRLDRANDVAIDVDGKIVLAGDVQTSETGFDFGVARLNPDGSLDTSFDEDGRRTLAFDLGGENVDFANAVGLDGDRIVLGGRADGAVSVQFAFARLNNDGSLDDSFGDSGQVTVDFEIDADEIGLDLVVDEAGGVLAVGTVDPPTSNRDFGVIRLRNDGTLDPSFGGQGRTLVSFDLAPNPEDQGKAIALTPDGRVQVAGVARTPSGFELALAQLDKDELPPEVARILPVEPNPRNTGLDAFEVVFTELIDPDTLTLEDLEVTRDGEQILTLDPITVTQVGSDPIYRITGLEALTSESGAYEVTVFGDGVTDLAGNDGTGSATASFVVDATPPEIVELETVDPDPRFEGISELEVRFSEPLAEGSFTIEDVVLTRNGSAVALEGGPVIEAVEGTEATFRITGLDAVTERPGFYELTVEAEGVSDEVGNAGVGTATEAFNLRQRLTEGDYDGDGIPDLAVYSFDEDAAVGRFEILRSTDGETLTVELGGPGDVPISGDFDGDGITDVAIFQPQFDLTGDGNPDAGQWTIIESSSGDRVETPFGAPGNLDRPAPGDFDGDGITDIATFRPNSDLLPGAAEWFILRSSEGPLRVAFGAANGVDLPAVADFDGDGLDDIATFRPEPHPNDFNFFDPEGDGIGAQWFVLQSEAGARRVEFGAPGGDDQPVPHDFDADGRADIGAFRSESDLVADASQWFLLSSLTGAGEAITFGDSGDIAAVADYTADGVPDLAVFDPETATWRIRELGSESEEVITFGTSGPNSVPVLAPLAFRLIATGNSVGASGSGGSGFGSAGLRGAFSVDAVALYDASEAARRRSSDRARSAEPDDPWRELFDQALGDLENG